MLTIVEPDQYIVLWILLAYHRYISISVKVIRCAAIGTENTACDYKITKFTVSVHQGHVTFG